MTDILLVSVGLLMIVGVIAFYFHGRLTYTDKKIGLLENLLMDIKMTLDVETQGPSPHEHFVAGAPASTTLPGSNSGAKFVPLSETVEEEETSVPAETEADYYSSVIQQAADVAVAQSDSAATAAADAVPTVNYEAQTRDELVTLAEQRGLRVTKRLSKPQIIALLREGEKQQRTPATLEGAEPVGGAPLDADAPQEVSLDD